MDHDQQLIGTCNDNGNTVLRMMPQLIKLIGFDIVLQRYTGSSYTILIGIWAGEEVQPGDYLAEVDAFWRPASWLLSNPTMWEEVKMC